MVAVVVGFSFFGPTGTACFMGCSPSELVLGFAEFSKNKGSEVMFVSMPVVSLPIFYLLILHSSTVNIGCTGHYTMNSVWDYVYLFEGLGPCSDRYSFEYRN